MSVHKTAGSGPPFDESTLRALFDEVEPRPMMEARWRARVALTPPEAPPDLPDLPRIRVVRGSRPQGKSWLRTVGAAVAVMAVGGGVIGVVSVSRQPMPNPPPQLTISETVTSTPTTNPPQLAETSAPATDPSSPLGSQPAGVPTAGPSVSGGPAGVPTAGPPTSGGPVSTAKPAGPPAPAQGPLAEWPDAANTGLPAGTALQVQAGDLHITQAGALIADRHVTGSVYVEAPNVTLRRVLVTPPQGAFVIAGVWQLSSGSGLRIEDSEVSTGGNAQFGIRQEAAGLHVQRSEIRGTDSAVAVTSDTTIVDSYLPNWNTSVQTSGNTARLTVRHNTISTVSVTDEDGPVTDVTIENNQLGNGESGGVMIFAPSRPGSRDIRVTNNQFPRNSIPSSGWNAQAPGNVWTGNVWSGTSEPVNPY